MRHPALALLEYESVAAGIAAADAMTKRAPIALLRCGTVQPGRYLVLLAGTVASVEEAHALGATLESLGDEILLPNVDGQLYEAVMGARKEPRNGSLGVLETSTAPALLRAADAAVKGAEVEIVELRFSDDLGGHAFMLLDGLLDQVEAALRIGAGRLDSTPPIDIRLLPRLDENVRRLLAGGTRFAEVEGLEPEGAEGDHVPG